MIAQAEGGRVVGELERDAFGGVQPVHQQGQVLDLRNGERVALVAFVLDADPIVIAGLLSPCHVSGIDELLEAAMFGVAEMGGRLGFRVIKPTVGAFFGAFLDVQYESMDGTVKSARGVVVRDWLLDGNFGGPHVVSLPFYFT